MATFTVRVELLGYPDRTTYENLEKAMKTMGFTDRLNDNGVIYELPPAEYIGTKELSTIQVLALVKNIVHPVWSEFRVFVTQAQGRWEYYNLKKIQ